MTVNSKSDPADASDDRILVRVSVFVDVSYEQDNPDSRAYEPVQEGPLIM